MTYTHLADVIIQFSATMDPPHRKLHASPLRTASATCQGHEPYIDPSPLMMRTESSTSEIPQVAVNNLEIEIVTEKCTEVKRYTKGIN